MPNPHAYEIEPLEKEVASLDADIAKMQIRQMELDQRVKTLKASLMDQDALAEVNELVGETLLYVQKVLDIDVKQSQVLSTLIKLFQDNLATQTESFDLTDGRLSMLETMVTGRSQGPSDEASADGSQ